MIQIHLNLMHRHHPSSSFYLSLSWTVSVSDCSWTDWLIWSNRQRGRPWAKVIDFWIKKLGFRNPNPLEKWNFRIQNLKEGESTSQYTYTSTSTTKLAQLLPCVPSELNFTLHTELTYQSTAHHELTTLNFLAALPPPPHTTKTTRTAPYQNSVSNACQNTVPVPKNMRTRTKKHVPEHRTPYQRTRTGTPYPRTKKHVPEHRTRTKLHVPEHRTRTKLHVP